MKQTEQYGLNQWELTDRILMSDFNADNAKIAAALAKKMGLFENLYIDSSAMNSWAFSIPHFVKNWNEVNLLFHFIHPTFSPPTTTSKIQFALDRSDGQTEQSVDTALLEPADTLLVLFPLRNENRLVEGVVIGGSTKVFQLDFPFKQLGRMRFTLLEKDTVRIQYLSNSIFQVR